VQITIRLWRSDTSGAVPDSTDSTTKSIDSFFDAIDRVVDSTDRVLNRSKRTEDQLDAHRPKRAKRAEAIDVEASERKPRASTPSTKPVQATQRLAIARKPHFHIVEKISPSGTIFVVTDGGAARTECATREFAEKILRALESA
jgi:hypothetical protein